MVDDSESSTVSVSEDETSDRLAKDKDLKRRYDLAKYSVNNSKHRLKKRRSALNVAEASGSLSVQSAVESVPRQAHAAANDSVASVASGQQASAQNREAAEVAEQSSQVDKKPVFIEIF